MFIINLQLFGGGGSGSGLKRGGGASKEEEHTYYFVLQDEYGVDSTNKQFKATSLEEAKKKAEEFTKNSEEWTKIKDSFTEEEWKKKKSGNNKSSKNKIGGGDSGFKYEDIPSGLEPNNQTRVTKRAREQFEKAYTSARVMVKSDREYGHSSDRNIEEPFYEDRHSLPSLNSIRSVQALINSEKKSIDTSEKLGIISKEKAQQKREALNAVQRGLNRRYDFYQEMHNQGKYKKKK